MATTYYQSDTNLTIDYVVAAHEKSLLTTTSTQSDLSINVAASSIGEWFWGAATGEGTTDWTTSTYAAQYNVQAIGATSTFTFHLRRFESTYSFVRGGSLLLATGVSGTGLKSYTSQTWTNVNTDSNRASTDVFGMSATASNTNMMSAETSTLRVNTTDSYAIAPWTLSSPSRDYGAQVGSSFPTTGAVNFGAGDI